jgi:hypothetical protein
VTGGANSGDSGIPHGALLIEFAEAILGDDDERLAAARSTIVDVMGAAALVDAAGIAGFFNAIDRVADSTGTPLDEAVLADTESLREELGINDLTMAKRTLA